MPAHDAEVRKRLAEYLLRSPSFLHKIIWNATSKTVIYRSKRHHTTRRNFEVLKAHDVIAAAIEPPWRAIKEWIADDEPDLDWFNQTRPSSGSQFDPDDQSPAWQLRDPPSAMVPP